MSSTEDLPWTCPCGSPNVSRARVSWPLGASPEDGAALATLLTNTFHVFPCVRCGYPAVVDRNLLVIHHAERWAVQVAHDTNERASIAPKLAQGFPGYRTRVVADRLALVERARLLHQGIDDVAMEIARFEQGLRLGLSVDPHSRLLFDRIEGESVVFALLLKGAKTGELTTPRGHLHTLAIAHATASFLDGPLVDEALVRRLLVAASAPPPIHRYATLPITPTELFARKGSVIASNRQVAVSLSTSDGILTPIVVPAERPERHALPAELRREETLDGPFTSLAGVRLYGDLLDAAKTRAGMAALALDRPGHSPVVVPWSISAERPPEDAFPFSSPLLVADDDAIVALERAETPYFLLMRVIDVGAGPTIAVTCVPLPPEMAERPLLAALNEEHLAVACGTDLVLYGRGDLGIRPGFALQAADLVPWVLPPQPLAHPGKVVMGVGSKLLVDRPDVGRMTLERSPTMPVKAGEPIWIVDARENLPRQLRVLAYSFPDGRAWSAEKPAIRKIPSVSPPPVVDVAPPKTAPTPRRSLVPHLDTLATRFDVRVPPALRALATAERDLPAVARALEILGLSTTPLSNTEATLGQRLVTDWDADPNLFGLMETGTGDVDALYLYPPLLQPGREPLVVRFCHEEGELELRARSFDEFFDAALNEEEREHPELVALVRRVLPTERTPPEGLFQGPLPDLDRPYASRGSNDPRLAAERELCKRFGAGQQQLAADLHALYTELGWAYAAEMTRTKI
jgi:hypothetical protein